MTEALKQKIHDLEQELFEKRQEVTELRKQLPAEAVEDYTLRELPAGEDEASEVRLSDLFGDRRDLIVIHNMSSKCPYCTLWADGFNGMHQHFEDRAALALINGDAPETQRAFADGRGWRFRMVSAAGTSFVEDMGFAGEHEGKPTLTPGFSTFRRRDDGSIVRVGHDVFGPGDVYCGIWHMFGLLEGGTDGWGPKFSY